MKQGTRSKAKYKRVILKLSGEALAGSQGFGISPAQAEKIDRLNPEPR